MKTAKSFSSFLNTSQPQANLLPIIAFMAGILVYFTLSQEPSLTLLLCGTFLAVLPVYFIRHPRWLHLCCGSLLFFLFGIFICTLHAFVTQTVFLPAPLQGEESQIRGVVESVQPQRQSYQIELTDVKIKGLKPSETPQKVRLTIRSLNLPVWQNEEMKVFQKTNKTDMTQRLKTGDTIVGIPFVLKAPNVPVAQGGYYQARELFFEGIGALGSLSSAAIIQISPDNTDTLIERARQHIHHRLKAQLGQETNGVAQALVLGDSRQLTTPVRTLYRTLGLSHILSVSGFHISLIAFLIFVLLRYIFVLLPVSGKTVFFKQIAGVIALTVAGLYVLLSHAQPPAVRAFIMVAFVFLCVFIDRRALSVYAVAVAAFLILCLKPVLLLNAGFQLSFIAVLSLVVLVQECTQALKDRFWRHKFLLFISGLVFLNIVVTLATVPFVAYHFHQFAVYSLLGNLLLSFVFSLAVLPLLAMGIVLLPFGASAPFLTSVDFLLKGVHQLGEQIALLPHAMVYIPAFSGWGLVVFSAGFLWICLFRGSVRWVGVPLMLIALFSFLTISQPAILIGQGGRVFAVRNEQGNWQVSESFRHRFITDQWLAMNGQNPTTYQEAKRFYPDFVSVHGHKIAFAATSCSDAVLTIALKKGDYSACPTPVYLKSALAQKTPLFIFVDADKVRVVSGAEQDKDRPWGLKENLSEGNIE